MKVTRYSIALATAGLAAPALAADVQLSLELPRLDVAEYHKPYVALWLERVAEPGAAISPSTSLAVWYDLKKPNQAGSKWLADMRQWWRKSGRDLSLPADGVSGATRAPGEQKIKLGDHKALAHLAPGKYELVVEAAREGGGREVLRLPLQWPITKAAQASVQGEHELGSLTLSVKP